MTITVHYYDTTATKIMCTRTYPSRRLAMAAMRRAAKRGQIAGIAGKRTTSDQPTCHH